MTMDRNRETDGVRLGVDFGVCTTVIAACGPKGGYSTLGIPGFSREFAACTGSAPVHVIPSLVEYSAGKAVRLGDEVLRRGADSSPATARWLRQYLCDKSPVQVPAGDGRMVRYEEAAADFLIPLLRSALSRYPEAGLVFTVPLDAPGAYTDFLHRAARDAGARSCACISEERAAAAGCGHTPAREPFLLITFDETGLGVKVLAADDRPAASEEDGLRVLAHAAASTGCLAVDGWILQDLLAKFRLPESDPRAVRLMPQIRAWASRLRECLTAAGETEVRLNDPVSGRTFTAVYTAADLDRILADHDVIFALRECMDRAVSALRIRGGDERRLSAVILLGAGCALPAVQDAVRSRFLNSVVCADHPLDAVARGAAGYTAPLRAQDRISCSYALRYWDPSAREHHYRFIVHSGAPYPSAGQVARIVISAAYDGQTLLGIPIYEISGTAEGALPRIELVSDTGGGVRLAGPAQDAAAAGPAVHANGRSPTLLAATPPARRGEPRFECTFTIDHERNLCLSARDLVTGMLVKVNAPVHRLM